MNDIIQQLRHWPYLQSLPEEQAGFVLEVLRQQQDARYVIFTYAKPDARRTFSVLYDSVTKEFAARVCVGLTEFCDISFFTPDLASLETVLRTRLESTLLGLECGNPCTICCEKKIMEWSYTDKLPQTYAGFTLFISPRQPLKIINGSYIIVDYSDFSTDSNLLVFYNIFRDEFFGEIRIHQTPHMTAVFDCRTLADLEEKLTAQLRPVLETARCQIAGSQTL